MNQNLDAFSPLMTDTLSLHKPDGRVFEHIKACVSGKGVILIEDVSLPIEVGDRFARVLPSSLTEEFMVDDPVYCAKFHMIEAHYQVKVHRASTRRPAPRHTDVGNQFRFQVALSFPGQHRPRIEKIALTLADALGRERVLYDKWHSAEFARPNLDVYLPKLYHEQSLLLVFFLCSQFVEKEWCGLEWRAGRDLLKQGEDNRLMLLRLDHADVPGIYSIDGYLNIDGMADEDVAAEILNRLKQLTVITSEPQKTAVPVPLVALSLAREQMVFEESVRWKRKNGGREGPYCPNCYEDKHKEIHLTAGATKGTYSCGVCRNSFTTDEYDPRPVTRRPFSSRYRR